LGEFEKSEKSGERPKGEKTQGLIAKPLSFYTLSSPRLII
jgi:hypothetical protein